jgi:hypothetical protein
MGDWGAMRIDPRCYRLAILAGSMRGSLLHCVMAAFASVTTGSEVLRTMDDLVMIGVRDCHGGRLLAACREGFCLRAVCYVWASIDGRSGTSQLPQKGWWICFDLISEDSRSSNWEGPPWNGHLNTWEVLGI